MFWAPEVYYVEKDKQFYMFYSTEEHICVATADSPLGPFKQDEHKPIREEKSIDTSVFFDEDGKAYLYFVRFNDGNVIWCAELKENLKEINKSSVMGMIIATIVRIFLFLAVLGVVVKGVTLDAANPAADAFKQGAGEIGYRFAGLVLLCAAITSIIGAAYTSVSFLKTFSKSIEENENKVIIGFIIISTAIMFILGNPAVLLVLAGAVNGLILPITLAICLIAAHKKSIMGENYHHPVVLTILGVIVVILTAYLGVTTFVSKIGTLL